MKVADEDLERGDALSVRWDRLSTDEAEVLAREVFSVAGTARRLASEKDDTFQIMAGNGTSFTLKMSNPKENAAGLAFQDGALLHLEQFAPEVPVPRLVRTREGETCHVLPLPEGGVRIARMMSFIDGELLSQCPPSIAGCMGLGEAFAKLGAGLASYRGQPAETILWDISHLPGLTQHLRHVHKDRRPAVQAVIANCEAQVGPLVHRLRRQVIHNDLNPHNILVNLRPEFHIAGFIDFGDMVRAPLINDLAVAASYHLASVTWLERLCALVEGYNRITPLQDVEFSVLPGLIKARLAMTIAITEWRAAGRPDEATYILRNHAASWQGLCHLNTMPDAALSDILHAASKD